jgi:hypothetical protein
MTPNKGRGPCNFIEELMSRTWVASAKTQTQAGRHASTHTHHHGYTLVLMAEIFAYKHSYKLHNRISLRKPLGFFWSLHAN